MHSAEKEIGMKILDDGCFCSLDLEWDERRERGEDLGSWEIISDAEGKFRCERGRDDVDAR